MGTAHGQWLIRAMGLDGLVLLQGGDFFKGFATYVRVDAATGEVMRSIPQPLNQRGLHRHCQPEQRHAGGAVEHHATPLQLLLQLPSILNRVETVKANTLFHGNVLCRGLQNKTSSVDTDQQPPDPC